MLIVLTVRDTPDLFDRGIYRRPQAGLLGRAIDGFSQSQSAAQCHTWWEYCYNQQLEDRRRPLRRGELIIPCRERRTFSLRSDYIDRLSSGSLVAVSPLAGNVSGFRITLGLTHDL